MILGSISEKDCFGYASGRKQLRGRQVTTITIKSYQLVLAN